MEKIKLQLKEFYEDSLDGINNSLKVVEDLVNSVSNLREEEKRIKERISNLTKENISLENRNTELKIVSDSIKSLNQTTTIKVEELKKLEREIFDKTQIADRIIDDAKKIKADYENSVKEDKEFIAKQRMTQDEREKNLNQKENDLLIVETRWHKIYGDKGKSFKIE